jgi:hypothetical protein
MAAIALPVRRDQLLAVSALSILHVPYACAYVNARIH